MKFLGKVMPSVLLMTPLPKYGNRNKNSQIEAALCSGQHSRGRTHPAMYERMVLKAVAAST